MIFQRIGRTLDDRTGSASLLSRGFRYVFPDHWTFLFGEIALYCFLILVGTGVYLTFFFEPSTAQVIYDGSYAPLQGQEVSEAYDSAVRISLDVKAGLLIRQTHHWAALVFVAAIVVHMLRVFFTGAFRRPARPELDGRDLARAARPDRGLRRLLAARRPALGHGPGDRLLGSGRVPDHRRVARRPLLGGRVPGRGGLHLAPLRRPRLHLPDPHIRVARPAPVHGGQAPAHAVRGAGARGAQRHRLARLPRLRAALGQPVLRHRGRAAAAGRADPDQPDLAVRRLPALARDERGPAGLLLRLAHRGAAAHARLGAGDQRLHDHPEPVLRGDPLSDDRVRDPVRLAVARAALQRRHRPAPPDPASARRPVAHWPGGRAAPPGDDGPDRRLRRPDLRVVRDLLRDCRSGSGASRRS